MEWFTNLNGNDDRRDARAKRRWRARALLAAIEPLERRLLMSFYAGLSAPDGPIHVGDTFTMTAVTDGSVTPGSETFNWGDGTSSGPYSNPGTFKQADNTTYAANTQQNPSYSPNLSVTPSGGTAYTVPLTLDSTFGVSPTYSGKSAAAANGNTYTSGGGTAMAIDPTNGEIYVAAAYKDASRTQPEFSVTKFTSTGSVDSTWGANHGTTAFNFDGTGPQTANIPYCIVFDKNTGIYVGGTANGKFCVARLTSAGFLDQGFGAAQSGVITLSQSGQVNSMTVENKDNPAFLVLAGSDGTGTKMALARMSTATNGSLPAGTLDSTFGPSGTGMETFSSFGAIAESANFVMQADFFYGTNSFDLLVGGYAQFNQSCCGTYSNSMVLALTDTAGQIPGKNAGVLDTTNFGSGQGWCYTNVGCVASVHPINSCSGTGFASGDNSYSLVCWTSGNSVWFIYSVGPTNYVNDVSPEYSFVRYTEAGVRDTTWGTQGIVAIASGPAGNASDATPYAATIDTVDPSHSSDPESDSNALIVAAGTGAYGSTGCDFILARIFASSGALDNSFGSSGQTYTDMTPSGTTFKNDIAKSVVMYPNTLNIIAAGSTSYGNGQLAIASYRPNNQIVVKPLGGAPPPASAQPEAAVSGQILSLAQVGAQPQPVGAPAAQSNDRFLGTYDDPLVPWRRRRSRPQIPLRAPG